MSDESKSEQPKAFADRVKSMSEEELLALAAILKRRSSERAEELQVVTEHLEAHKRIRSNGKLI